MCPAELAPLDDERQLEVVERTNETICRAARLLNVRLAPVPVLFDLRGRSAGMFRAHGSEAEIRYNPWLFARFYAENLEQTVPHEVAHYAVFIQYQENARRFSRKRSRVRPHGPEWQETMRLLGVEPRTTCDFDLSGIPHRRLARFSYTCGCRSHELTSIRHNRIVSGRSRYHCRECREPLKLQN